MKLIFFYKLEFFMVNKMGFLDSRFIFLGFICGYMLLYVIWGDKICIYKLFILCVLEKLVLK